MNRIAVIRVSAWLIFALGLGVAAAGTMQAQRAEAAITAARSKARGLDAAIQRQQSRAEAVKREAEQIQSELMQMRATPAPRTEGAGQMTPQLANLLLNPGLLNLYLDAYRADLSQHYASFYRLAHLNDQTITEFESLACKHQAEAIDLAAATAAQHLSPGDPAIAAMQKNSDERFRSDEEALLGQANFHLREQLDRAEAARPIVLAAAMLALDSEPYTGAQAAELMRIIGEASPAYRQGGALDLETVDWSSATAHADRLLSPPQREAFEAQLLTVRLSQLMRNYFALRAGGSTP